MSVVTEASLDDLRSEDVRFLQEAARGGPLHVRIPSDALLQSQTGAPPRFPLPERLFLADSLRWISTTEVVDAPLGESVEALAAADTSLVLPEEAVDGSFVTAAGAAGVDIVAVSPEDRAGFPEPPADEPGDAPRVIITGCYDWLHSGHIRFFMDAAAYGNLYAVVGSDRNVSLLKGPGHPLQREEERRYMVGSVKPVHRCLVSSGSGWMDAEPEIEHIKPTYYVVNEDGDQPEKRAFCAAHGLEYVVLERVPHEGLPRRSSTDLRGF